MQIAGDFDDAMQRVQQVARKLGIYLVNSINPFRLEGQKTIMYRVLEALRWEVPDWIVVPGGNLGNVSAFGKAFIELIELGLVTKTPRLAVINAAGANTFYSALRTRRAALEQRATRPRRIRGLLPRPGRREHPGGDDRQRHRDQSAREPAQGPACPRLLRRRGARGHRPGDPRRQGQGRRRRPGLRAGVRGQRRRCPQAARGRNDRAGDRVVCILTGHQLKDPTATVAYHSTDQKTFDDVLGQRGVRRATFANRAVQVPNDLDEIIKAIEVYS